jgi:hypothetical protein
MDHGRDPCPFVIFNDFGGAFCMGVSFPQVDLLSLRVNPTSLKDSRNMACAVVGGSG